MDQSAPQIRLIRPEERALGPSTGGMLREQAVATQGMWSGFVRTDAGMVSGWHHHGDYETTIFVLTGVLRLESGPAGSVVHEARPGDFLHIPAGVIHREANPAAEESHIIVVRAGRGESVFNVDGPIP